jgi:rhodanese-related sulfurtransferase
MGRGFLYFAMPYHHLSVQEVAQLMHTHDRPVVLVDVREAHEYALAHIADAVLCPLSQFATWASHLDQTAYLVVICHHGIRSAAAAQLLDMHYGYTHVATMDGGIDAWSCEIDPTIPRY